MNLNVLAYYCYKTGNAPKSASDIKAQAIALPNAKIFRTHSYGISPSISNYGAMLQGEGVVLHYIDENGVDKGTTFPAGTSIGWILYSNGYQYNFVTSPPQFDADYNLVEKGRLTTGEGAVYSDPALMNGYAHVAVFRSGDFVVSSFEDGRKINPTDVRDYKDVIFHVGASPADAITPDIPDVKPEEPKDVEVTYRGILSFEDNWPYMGDFDMNDVVVKYESTIRQNSKNQVVSTTDVFTVLWSGAAYDNSFAYQNLNLDKSQATVTFSGGDGTSAMDGTNIIRLASKVLAYANNSEKKVFTVETKYATPIDRIEFIYPPYNPFITVKSQNDIEVHLTNAIPTPYADMQWFGYGKDRSVPSKNLYYITYDDNGDQMPFGIDMMFSTDEQLNGYVIPAEKEPINTYYPNFITWLKSGGKDSQDWYLHPKK